MSDLINSISTTFDNDLNLPFKKYFGFTNITERYEDFIGESKNENYARFNFIKTYHIKSSKASYATSATLDTKIEEFDTFESEDPFDTIDESKGNNEKVEEIISFLEKGSKLKYSARLAKRLKYLFEVSIEEYPDEVPISYESLKNCLNFLQTTYDLKYPDIVLSPSKNIRAQWRTGPNRHFAAEFYPTGNVHFVIFSPDSLHPEKPKRLSGLTSIETLLETVKPQGILAWSCNEK
ncbi:MAG: hypothetical protein JW786_07845 [Desulfobacterales bacterium]|nr:hypothetical protein [Desulfobacterales bacterium]